MKKASTQMADQDIPELKRAQLGKGARGKYLKHFMQGSNVVVLRPEIQKAFPTSEAVNKALASLLAFAQEAQGLTGRPGRTPRRDFPITRFHTNGFAAAPPSLPRT